MRAQKLTGTSTLRVAIGFGLLFPCVVLLLLGRFDVSTAQADGDITRGVNTGAQHQSAVLTTTVAPTATATSTPTSTATGTPTSAATATPSSTATPSTTPTATAIPTAVITPTVTPTLVLTAAPTLTATAI